MHELLALNAPIFHHILKEGSEIPPHLPIKFTSNLYHSFLPPLSFPPFSLSMWKSSVQLLVVAFYHWFYLGSGDICKCVRRCAPSATEMQYQSFCFPVFHSDNACCIKRASIAAMFFYFYKHHTQWYFLIFQSYATIV